MRARISTVYLLASFFGLATSAAAAAPPAVAGHWEGAIELPGTSLTVLVDLTPTNGAWSGTIDIPMQGAKGLGLMGIAAAGDSLSFAIDKIPGRPTFRGLVAGDKVTGQFTQGGQSFPFHLGREKQAAPARPQEPKPPFPYRVEDVGYENGEVHLAATLTLPAGQGPFPTAVLITGSGAENRDEEVFGHKPFLVLADALTRAGIAVLRADDRGVGGSSSTVSRSTTSDFADDALAGVRFLKTRAEIDPAAIGLIGHSEGGIAGPLAAARAPQDVAFVVLLAGTGVPLDEVILRQTELIMRAGGASPEEIATQTSQTKLLMDLVKSGADSVAVRTAVLAQIEAQLADQPDSVRAAAGDPEAQADAIMQGTFNPWFRYAVSLDPRIALRQVTCPVLAVNGTLDLQVDPEQNLPEIERALREGGNADVTIQRFPGLNHLFQTAATGSVTEYGTIEETMNPAVLAVVQDWILARFAGTR